MTIRETSRVLLFDNYDRLLLMKVDVGPEIRDPGKPWLTSPFWVTLGGRIEEGEDVLSAAHREISEETGLCDVAIGPAVWYGEQSLETGGETRLLRETFVVARTDKHILSSDRWTTEERKAIVAMRWWPIDELESTTETILPPMLIKLIRPISERKYGESIVTIDLSARP
jgi:8-oxo-dGTP pyrophosphatase MutT (NUDIX family)